MYKELLILLSIILVLQQANGQETYDVAIWSDPSEIILGSSTVLGLKICPTPSTDQRREIVESENGIITDPGSQILVNYFVTRPNGSQTMQQRIQPFSCESSWHLDGLQPDMVGTWSVYAVAKWISEGSMHEAQSNKVNIIVKERLFSGKIEKIVEIDRVFESFRLDPDKLKESALRGELSTSIEFQQFDWSPKGNFITFTTIGIVDRYTLWLMNSDGSELKRINIPFEFEGISFPRVSPSEYSIMFVGHYYQENKPQEIHIDLFKYSIKEEKLHQITRTQSTNTTFQWAGSFDWISDDNIVYVETLVEKDSGKSDSQLWLADSDGNKIRKLLSRSRDTMIGDASPDGRKILFTSGRIFDVHKEELDGVLSFVIDRNGHNARWNNNGELVVYSSTGGYGPGGTMYLTSVDGTYDQILHAGIPKPLDPAISPDGRFIVFGSPIATWDRYEDAGIYRMELSKPIPEFPILLIALVSSFAALIFAGRFVSRF